MSTALAKLTENLATSFSLDAGNSKELLDTLKATAFKIKEGVVSDAQMTALMIVSQQYGLNPWVKEIYAYPDKQNGIVPVVGVDGWIRIINQHSQFDGMEFHYAEEMKTPPGGKPCPVYIDCIIYRKDRVRPTVVREYLDEVYKESQYKSPWQTHTKRFLRHKALIQCARIAFGFVGIFDQDEAERIVEGEKIINPLPEVANIITAQMLVDKIKNMTDAQLTPDALRELDLKTYTDEEKRMIRGEITLRRRALKEAAVVATQPPEPSQPDAEDNKWQQLIDNATSTDELMSAYHSIPEELRPTYLEAVELKEDLLRSVGKP
jgi:phage recombination protein Bet